MKEKNFWSWFIESKQLYENICSDITKISQEEIGDAMHIFEEALHSYNESLWFRMGGGNPYELIITAEGDRDYFPAVIKLVDASPTIDDWKIVPFIQPTNLFKFRYEKDGYELSDKDIFFSYTENKSGIGGYFFEVMFYVEDVKFIEDDGFKSSIIRISESALGEYDFATMIGFIDVVPKSEVYMKHESGLLPIHKLSEIVETGRL